jgi:hypothetical protein
MKRTTTAAEGGGMGVLTASGRHRSRASSGTRWSGSRCWTAHKNRTKAIQIRNQTAANPSTARAYSNAETDGGAGEELASSHLHGQERRAPLAPSGELQPGGGVAAARGARALGERTARRDGWDFIYGAQREGTALDLGRPWFFPSRSVRLGFGLGCISRPGRKDELPSDCIRPLNFHLYIPCYSTSWTIEVEVWFSSSKFKIKYLLPLNS